MVVVLVVLVVAVVCVCLCENHQYLTGGFHEYQDTAGCHIKEQNRNFYNTGI